MFRFLSGQGAPAALLGKAKQRGRAKKSAKRRGGTVGRPKRCGEPTARQAPYPRKALKMTVALCPPKPSELDRTTSTDALRAWLGM